MGKHHIKRVIDFFKGSPATTLGSERGNVFFTLFGAVAVVGLLGTGIMSTLKGPLSTMVEINRIEEAKADMRINARLILTQPQEIDTDTFQEPLEPDLCTIGVGGAGCIPGSIGAKRSDPWGNDYAYCAWNLGTDFSAVGRVLEGDINSNFYTIAVISSGPDLTFSSNCSAAPPAVSEGGDDIIIPLTYEQALASSGGLWTLDSADPNELETTRNIEVGGSATFGGALNLSGSALPAGAAASLLLPTQAELASCNAANDKLLRVNTTVNPHRLEICDNGIGFVSAGSLWVADGSNNITYAAGDVAITGGNDLSVAGATTLTGALTANGGTTTTTLNATGATDLDTTLNVDGNTTLGGTLGVTGATTLSDTLGVTGNTTVGGTLGVTGATTLSDTLNVTGATTITNTIDITGTTTVNGTTTITGNTDIDGTLNVTGVVTLDEALSVGDVALFQDDVTLTGGNLDVTGNIDASGDISTTGTSTITAGGTIFINGSEDLDPETCSAGDRIYWDGDSWECQLAAPGGTGTGNTLVLNDLTDVNTSGSTGSSHNCLVYDSGSWIKDRCVPDEVFDLDLLSYDPTDGSDERIILPGGSGSTQTITTFDTGATTGANIAIISGPGTTGGNTIISGGDGTSTDGNVILSPNYGAVGVGTTTVTPGLLVDIEGNIGAVEYCDETGSGCIDIGSLGSTIGVFEVNSGVVRNRGDHATEDFVFGSSTLDSTGGQTNRFFYDKNIGAFRAGIASGTQWNTSASNVGTGSSAFGTDNIASGSNSFAAGLDNTASQGQSIALGENNTASSYRGVAIGFQNTAGTSARTVAIGSSNNVTGQVGVGIGNTNTVSGNSAIGIGISNSATNTSAVAIGDDNNATNTNTTAIGYDNTASGLFAMTFGDRTTASGNNALTLGQEVKATGINTVAIGLADQSNTDADRPQVSGMGSFGIFMDQADNYNLASSDQLGIIGGELMIDTDANPTDRGCIRYNDGSDELEFSDDCNAYTSLASLGNSALAINDLTDAITDYTSGGSMYLGDNSGLNATSTSAANTALGFEALEFITAGASNNTGFGYRALNFLTSGNNNTVLGSNAGSTINTGSNNIIIGAGVNAASADGDNQLNIGDTFYGNLSTGDVGAIRYCDENLENCFSSTDVTNSPFEVTGASGSEIVNTVDSKAPHATADFVFGAPDTDNSGNITNYDARMFFDKSLGAFRAGSVTDNQWNDGNVGQYSFATGFRTQASGNESFALGNRVKATGFQTGIIGLSSQSSGHGNHPVVSGSGSMGIFMDQADNYNLSSTDTLGIIGGEIMIDTDANPTDKGCIRYNDSIDKLQFSNDCVTYDSIAGESNAVFEVAGSAGSETVRTMDSVAPYATADFIFGAPDTENAGGNTDYDNRMFFDKSRGAIRAGTVFSTQWIDANVGTNSTAFGRQTTASGLYSVAIGNTATSAGQAAVAIGQTTTASNDQATAFGLDTTASGVASTAINNDTTASGNNSFASGRSTTASGTYSIAMGQETRATGTNTLALSLANQSGTDANRPQVSGQGSHGIFMDTADNYNISSTDTFGIIGGEIMIDGSTGTTPFADGNKGCIRYDDDANALEYSDDCSTYVPFAEAGLSTALFEVTGASGSELIRQNAALNPPSTADFVFGSTQLADAGNADYDSRFFFDKSTGAFRAGTVESTQWDSRGSNSAAFGNDTIATGTQSFAIGNETQATNTNSFAAGYRSVASGSVAVSFGWDNVASGTASFAMGRDNRPSGDQAIAMGYHNYASGDFSTAMGTRVKATVKNSAVFGLADQTYQGSGGSYPEVSGQGSLGIFMDTATNYNLSSTDTFGIIGGEIMIDGSTGSSLADANYGCIRYDDDANVLQYSDDCSTYVPFAEAGLSTALFEVTGSAGAELVRQNAALNPPSTADFVFGSTQLDDTGNSDHYARMFFDKSKGAFRVGQVDADQWDSSNVGTYSFAAGQNNTAQGTGAVAMGQENTVGTGNVPIAIGFGNTVSGQQSIGLGHYNTSTGGFSIAAGARSQATAQHSYTIGHWSTAQGLYSFALGHEALAASDYSFALSLADQGTTAGLRPQASAEGAMGIFMDQAQGYNLSSTDTFGIIGGEIMIDGSTGTTPFADANKGCIRYDDDANALEYSDDCSTYVPFADLGNGTLALNDLTDAVTDYGNTSSIYIGQNAGANTDSSNSFSNTALGTSALSTIISGENNTAIGDAALENATGDNNTAIGAAAGNAVSSGTDNTLIGNSAGINITTGSSNIIIGSAINAPSATADNQLNIGDFIKGNMPSESVAFGNNSIGGFASFVAGTGTEASGDYSFSIGSGTTASGNGSFAAGVDTSATGLLSFVFGDSAEATASGAIALGDSASASGDGAIALGSSAEATQGESVAIGFGAEASGEWAFAFGGETGATASGEGAIAMGDGSVASGGQSFALQLSTASGDNSIALGEGSIASAENASAIGSNVTASGNNSISLGQEVKATGTNTSALGLADQTNTDTDRPQISGEGSFGIFMDTATNYNLSSTDTFGIIGGELMIDGSTGTSALADSNRGCIRYNDDTNELQFSDDCSTYSSITNLATSTSLWQNDGPGGPDEIYYDVGSTGNVGIGTNNPNATLDIFTPAAAGAREQIFTARTGESTYSAFGIGNFTSSDSEFLPMFWGFNNDDNRSGLNFLGLIDNDVGTSDLGAIDLNVANIATDSADPINASRATLANHNVLSIRNNATQLLTIDADGQMGIGTAAPDEKLHVVGNFKVVGSVTTCTLGAGSGSTNCTSDERLKTDITEIDSALDKIDQLRGVSFKWKDQSKTQDTQIGVIAQDVEKVFPELVGSLGDEAQTKTVDYAALVAPLIEATKELKAENEALRKDIKALKAHTNLDTTQGNMGLGFLIGLLSMGLLSSLIIIIRQKHQK